jgi:diguanylate cyclase (GGDEF)-like protein
MSDSKTPQHDRKSDGAPDTELTTLPSPGRDQLGRVQRLARGRTGTWAAVAALCVAVGAVGSVLGARAVAHNDDAEARLAFPRTSVTIASTLKLAIQHEEDLIVSASTFFASNPRASAAEFDAWVKWTQTLHRYPELEKLGLVALVRSPELAAFRARIAAHTTQPLRAGSALPNVGSVAVARAGGRSFHCYAAVELARSPATRSGLGADYCALTPGLLSSRDSGLSVYVQASGARGQGLVVETPVYRGGMPPSGFASRRAAFVGWLREALAPQLLLGEVLRDHSQYAVRLRYKTSPSQVLFTDGIPPSGAQSKTINLHDGWTVRTFGPNAGGGGGVFTDGSALALLIAGSLLGIVLGLLVFLIGGGRARALAPKAGKESQEDLYDILTGLPNRALTLDRAERMVARAGRQPGMLAGALFIDVDWLKDVNDKLGQQAGDQLLVAVAQRLEQVVRAGDTVGRLGGDQFVVLVESAARGVRLDSLALRAIEALNEPLELDGFGPSFLVTASIGVAYGPYTTPDELLRDAQLALQAAKEAGKNRYTIFNANMRSMVESRGVLEIELNTALAEQQLFLLYQPIYDLTARKLVGLEALIRWLHPSRGVLAPAEFIPLAEETGLIVPIGRWALEQACGRAAAWNVVGHRVGVTVNVSANQLHRDGFATDVRRALQQSGLEPSLLTLDIAETTVMSDVAAAGERLREIKQLGVRIAIDDFGNGYAHRSDLQKVPIDFLNVDRSALAMSDGEDYRSWLLEAILAFARDLSLTVIAKKIETPEQMSAAQEIGCTMAQGFFMAGPTPADAVESLFEADFPASQPAVSGAPG